MNVMPSLGFGIGYQVGKRITIGFEHKSTFTLVDNFDCYAASSKYNDIYHYTSAYINFRFRGGGSGRVDQNTINNTLNNNNTNNNLTGCNSPVVTYISPNTSGLTSTTMTYNLVLEISNINTKENIQFKQNGLNSLNFTYNHATRRFEATVVLTSGTNTFEIDASNNCGHDVETFTINHSNCQSPIIAMVNPSSTSTSVMNASYPFSAMVQNVTNPQSVSVTLNNIVQTNVVYTQSNGSVQSNLTLTQGVNTITLTANNSCGTDSETFTINYQNCVSPKISITAPNSNNETVTSSNYSLNAVVTNVTSVQGLTVNQNNQAITNYNFNANTGSLISNVTLRPGVNTFIITSKNACGTDSKTVTVNYQNCIPPTVAVTNPGSTGTTVNSPTYSFKANIQQVTSASSITLKHNNNAVQNFSYNTNTGALTYQATLTTGINTFVISVVNGCGSDSKTVTVTFQRDNITTPEEKITICHYPPGNTGNPQQIEIPLSAWPAHQAHGDKLGPCPAVETPEEKITI
jgi:hypothetical protein